MRRLTISVFLTLLLCAVNYPWNVALGQANEHVGVTNDREVPWCGVFMNGANEVTITANGGVSWRTATNDEIADFSPFLANQAVNPKVITAATLAQETWVWPNPAASIVNLSFRLAGAETFRISVFNSIGQLLSESRYQQFSAGANTYSLSSLNLQAGVYHYVINSSSPTSGEFIIKR